MLRRLVLPVLLAAVALPAAFALAGRASVGTVGRAAAAADCHAVKFVGVRGSGDNSSKLGVIAAAINDSLRQKARSAGVDYGWYGLPYTAVGIELKATMPPEYWLSERQGRNMLRAYIREQVADCTNERLAVEGYSQGAQVVGDVFSKGVGGLTAPELSRVKAVALIADPRFNSQEPYDRGSFQKGNSGILGARSPGDLSSISGKVGAWCRKYDPVCQGLGTPANHAQSKYLADFKAAVGQFLELRLGLNVAGVSYTLPDCSIGTYGLHVAPSSWDTGCTGGSPKFSSLRWVGWGSADATGHGFVTLRVCNPDCIHSSSVTYPAVLVVSRPVPCKGTRMYSEAQIRWTGHSYDWRMGCFQQPQEP